MASNSFLTLAESRRIGSLLVGLCGDDGGGGDNSGRTASRTIVASSIVVVGIFVWRGFFLEFDRSEERRVGKEC